MGARGERGGIIGHGQGMVALVTGQHRIGHASLESTARHLSRARLEVPAGLPGPGSAACGGASPRAKKRHATKKATQGSTWRRQPAASYLGLASAQMRPQPSHHQPSAGQGHPQHRAGAVAGRERGSLAQHGTEKRTGLALPLLRYCERAGDLLRAGERLGLRAGERARAGDLQRAVQAAAP